MAAARGDVVIFLDDDVVPAAGVIEAHLDIHRSDSRAAVFGRIGALPGPKAAPPWVRWEMALLLRQQEALRTGSEQPGPKWFFTGHASVRREHALAIGGFDENLK